MAMQTKRALINTGLVLAGVMLSSVLLNLLVLRTGALGGICLTEALADEFRIWFMSIPANSRECGENRTSMRAGCEADFYGNNVRLPKSHIRINSLGFRGREYPIEKGGTTFRIFMVGDSFTLGEGVNDDETYAHVIEQRLNALSEGPIYEVFNLGVPGAATDNEYQRLLNYLQYSPDLVILQTDSNDLSDCGTLYTKINEALGIPDKRSVSFPKSIKMAETRREWRRQREEYVSQLGEDERCSCVRYYVELIANTATDKGIPFIIYIHEGDYNCLDGLRGNYTVVGPKRIERRYQLSRSDPHLNAAGHLLVAEELMPAILTDINMTAPDALA